MRFLSLFVVNNNIKKQNIVKTALDKENLNAISAKQIAKKIMINAYALIDITKMDKTV